MESSSLIVTIPAESLDLTLLATVKAELGITDTASDVRLETYIQQASDVCTDYCRTVFGRETLTETFRQNGGRRSSLLILSRRPVESVTSIEEDGTVLASTDYEINASAGMLRRLSSDVEIGWCAKKTVVVYIAGYLLLDNIPQSIERACIELVKNYMATGSRDASLKRESTDIPGVRRVEREWWVGASGDPALPREVTDLLDPHRNWIVA